MRIAEYPGRVGLTALFLLAVGAPLAVADDSEQEAFFEKRVRPVLIERCFECHGPDGQESDLRLDSLAATLKGGTRGPALVPGDPKSSLLILAVNHADTLQMPPRSKIPQSEIDGLTDWVQRGAHWPGEKAVAVTGSAGAARQITDEDRAFWAFRPIKRPPVPMVADHGWSLNPIDRFIFDALQRNGIAPSPAADRGTLIRRATFDLTGLPTPPADLAGWTHDNQPDRFDRFVNDLLGSSHYGPHWGRHWLDLARYGDSNGLDENLAYANAYRYRDYVVEAFNEDRPYDEFLREQIAGDLLPSDDPAVQFRRLTATGFLTIGAKMLAEDDPVKMEMDIIDEQVDTLARSVLGLTMGCARCHDHKYDPLTTRDYYALAGIFKSTKTMENFSVVAKWQERPLATASELEAHQVIAKQVEGVQSKIAELAATERSRIRAELESQTAGYLLAAFRNESVRSLPTIASTSVETDLAKVDGARLIEADQYDRGNVIKDLEHYGKGIGVLVNRGETPNFTEYDLEIPADGHYQVDIRLAAADPRPCAFSINGTVVRADAAGEVTGGWMPENQGWFVVGVYPLKAGKNVLRLEQPDFFPHIDKLLLTPAAGELKSPGDAVAAFIPEVLARWEALLKGDGPQFAGWRHFINYKNWDGFDPASDVFGADLLNDPRPATIDELAARYAMLLTVANNPDDKSPAQDLRDSLAKEQGPWSDETIPETAFAAAPKAELETLKASKAELEKTLPQFTEVMAVSDGSPQNLKVHLRGSHVSLGEESPRRFPEVLDRGIDPAVPADSSGRMQLADWITRPSNPLTARVIVNRIWQYHFGEGLVRSPDNFGKLGETPTHPELLDWLAAEFIESGWSIKHLHRLILSSATWQQSSLWNESGDRVDPENRLLWRMNRRRLEAESIRDTLLAVGGSLDDVMGGTLLKTENRKYVTSTANVDPNFYVSNRRTVYLPVVRSSVYDFLVAFDFGDPSVMQGQRPVTTVAPQALFLMNSAIVAEQSESLAKSLLAEDIPDDLRVQRLFETLLMREATEAQRQSSLAFVESYAGAVEEGDPAAKRERAWQALARALMATNEFLFVN